MGKRAEGLGDISEVASEGLNVMDLAEVATRATHKAEREYPNRRLPNRNGTSRETHTNQWN